MVLVQCAVGLAVTVAPSAAALMVVDNIDDFVDSQIALFPSVCLLLFFGAGSVQGFPARSGPASRVA